MFGTQCISASASRSIYVYVLLAALLTATDDAFSNINADFKYRETPSAC